MIEYQYSQTSKKVLFVLICKLGMWVCAKTHVDGILNYDTPGFNMVTLHLIMIASATISKYLCLLRHLPLLLKFAKQCDYKYVVHETSNQSTQHIWNK